MSSKITHTIKILLVYIIKKNNCKEPLAVVTKWISNASIFNYLKSQRGMNAGQPNTKIKTSAT